MTRLKPLAAIAELGLLVWGGNMFWSDMNPLLRPSFIASTIMIAFFGSAFAVLLLRAQLQQMRWMVVLRS